MMKKLGIVVGIIVVFFILLLVFKNFLIKTAVERVTKKTTGLELTIGNMAVSFLASKVDVTDMRLLNPAGFPDKVMIDVPKFLVDVQYQCLNRIGSEEAGGKACRAEGDETERESPAGYN
jgi:hypothetical protein